MDEPRTWIQAGDEADRRAARLVAQAAAIAPAPVDLTHWERIVAARSHQSPLTLVPAFALSMLAGVLLVLWARPTPVTPEVPVVMASAGATYTQQSGGVVRLEAGRLSVQRAAPARVVFETPHVQLDATNARFLAEVSNGVTTLVVEEGDVMTRAEQVTRVVHAGERAVWPSAPEIPERLTQPPERAVVCDEATDRRACLLAEASGEGLAAQVGLFELAQLELQQANVDAAVSALRTSLERFPDGVMHPEVRLGLLVQLTRARRFSEALEVARGFEANCADDPRLEQVQRLAASLERR